jgi:SAM-dependent methyltransferase
MRTARRSDRGRSSAAVPRRYPPEYYERFAGGSARSAAIVVPIVGSLAAVGSVADFGCGTGAWLAAWQQLGVDDVVGCDGPHVNPALLQFDAARFVAADLAGPVRLGRRFDLVQSLEVAEHLPPAAGPTFVDTLVSHGALVLFSAAVPGQGGEHHVNERPLEYWRELFRQRGFTALDALRPRVARDARVEPWYRYNSLLFADESRLESLEPALGSARVADGVRLRRYAPLPVLIGHRLLAAVPQPIVTGIAARLRRFTTRRPS